MYIYEKCNDVDTIKFDTQYESQDVGVHCSHEKYLHTLKKLYLDLPDIAFDVKPFPNLI